MMDYAEHFLLCLANGCSETLAEMLASRSFPATKGTDRAFMQGRKLDGSQFEGQPEIVRKGYLAKAREAGVNPAGKYYSGSLARFPGDPEAWVDSLHDVKRICESRGWECEGAVKVAAPKYAAEEPGPYRVADDIVDDHVAQIIDQRPELASKVTEVREEVQGRLSGVHG